MEQCLAQFDFDIDIDESIREVNAMLDSAHQMDIGRWRERIEPLPVSTSVPMPSIVEPPKLELKPLPKSLKYAFLGNGETLPVIIASDLEKDS